jgi:putative endonuclease
MNKQYYVYIITNKSNKVLYTGVTSDLKKRIYEHKEKLVKGFTGRYNVYKLVYYDMCEDIESAILREKQIKGWARKKKVSLIESMNPEWKDLSLE